MIDKGQMISKVAVQQGRLKALISAPVTAAELPAIANCWSGYLQAGHHGDMGWMARHVIDALPQQLMWDTYAAVIFGCNYGPDHDPMDNLAAKSSAVSVYARGRVIIMC